MWAFRLQMPDLMTKLLFTLPSPLHTHCLNTSTTSTTTTTTRPLAFCCSPLACALRLMTYLWLNFISLLYRLNNVITEAREDPPFYCPSFGEPWPVTFYCASFGEPCRLRFIAHCFITIDNKVVTDNFLARKLLQFNFDLFSHFLWLLSLCLRCFSPAGCGLFSCAFLWRRNRNFVAQ